MEWGETGEGRRKGRAAYPGLKRSQAAKAKSTCQGTTREKQWQLCAQGPHHSIARSCGFSQGGSAAWTGSARA